jgi:hypothetical protein
MHRFDLNEVDDRCWPSEDWVAAVFTDSTTRSDNAAWVDDLLSYPNDRGRFTIFVGGATTEAIADILADVRAAFETGSCDITVNAVETVEIEPNICSIRNLEIFTEATHDG